MTVDVWMIRPTLDDLPTWTLPAGFRFRSFRPGDDQTWLDLHLDAEPYVPIDQELWVGQFGGWDNILPERMYFVETEAGEPVGSITAWWKPDWQGRGAWGQIHWVVVKRAFQRRGLAKPMVAHALRRLAVSYGRAMLGTSTGRLWAIKTYLDAGFVPDPHERARPAVVAGWREVQETLRQPGIQAWLDD